MAIWDIIFDKIRFYNLNKPDLVSQLHVEIDQILKIVEIPYLPRPLISHDLDIKEDTDDERTNDRTKNTDSRR